MKGSRMPFIQVKRYSVTIRTSVGAGGTVAPLLNVIRMVPDPTKGSGNTISYVEFLYPRQAPVNVGEVPDQRVFGFFPPEEFKIHRLILQAESPVYVDWIVSASNHPDLERITLRTDPEPIGEGPADADA
jgi:hypothetical protein